MLYEEFFKNNREFRTKDEYITSDFNYARKAYDRGYEVKKKRRVNGVNWTQFNPNLIKRWEYRFKIVGISKKQIME